MNTATADCGRPQCTVIDGHRLSTDIATVANSWPLLALFLAIRGVAEAIGLPAANSALAKGIPVSRPGLAFGVKQAGPNRHILWWPGQSHTGLRRGMAMGPLWGAARA